MEIALVELSESENARLVRRRKRNNLIVAGVLVLFVAGVFATSFLHLQREVGSSIPSAAARQTITNQ